MKYVIALMFCSSLYAFADEPSGEVGLEFMLSGATCTYQYSKNESSLIVRSKRPEINLDLCLNVSVCTKGNRTVRGTQVCSIRNGKCPRPLECAQDLKERNDLAYKKGGGALADDSEDSFKLSKSEGKKADEYGRELKLAVKRPSVFRKKGPNGQTVKFCVMAVQATGGDANAPYLPPMIACTLKAEVTENGKTTAYCPGVYECAKNRYTSEAVEVAGIFKAPESIARRPNPRDNSIESIELVHQP